VRQRGLAQPEGDVPMTPLEFTIVFPLGLVSGLTAQLRDLRHASRYRECVSGASPNPKVMYQ
jgi:hypothetical protein